MAITPSYTTPGDTIVELQDLVKTHPEILFRQSSVVAARDTALPQAPGQVKYTVEQTVPMWGKRDLQRKIASAEAGSATEQRRVVETELAMRIKTVFAASYGTQETIRITGHLLDTVAAIARLAASRYDRVPGRGVARGGHRGLRHWAGTVSLPGLAG